jgi:hypothetical protein
VFESVRHTINEKQDEIEGQRGDFDVSQVMASHLPVHGRQRRVEVVHLDLPPATVKGCKAVGRSVCHGMRRAKRSRRIFYFFKSEMKPKKMVRRCAAHGHGRSPFAKMASPFNTFALIGLTLIGRSKAPSVKEGEEGLLEPARKLGPHLPRVGR